MDKKRSSNFTHEEDQLLVALVLENKNIIECKKSNAVSWKEKENTWKKIENKFNVNCSVLRSNKWLKDRYKNIKKLSKKNILETNKTYF